MTQVRFASEVPDELAEVVVWYEAKRQGLGGISRAAVHKAIQQKRLNVSGMFCSSIEKRSSAPSANGAKGGVGPRTLSPEPSV